MCHLITPLVLQLFPAALNSPSPAASAETQPGLRVVTQFRHTASHLGPQAPNVSTAGQSGLYSFTYVYK